MDNITTEIAQLREQFIQEGEFQVQVDDTQELSISDMAKSHITMSNQMKRMQQIFINSLKINEKLHA